MSSANLAFMIAPGQPPPRKSGAGAPASPLRLALASRTAIELPVGEIVGDFVGAALGLADDLRMSIICAVHEAVLNAVLHGNLALANEGRDHAAGGDEFAAAMAARLADPALAARRCEIRIRWTAAAVLVRITDQGAGFAAPVPSDPALPWGRGIPVIKALATRCRWVRGGRSLMLRFAR